MRLRPVRLVTIVLLTAACALPAAAHESDALAHYLANEGLMVAHGDTKVLFDPLFNESFRQYRLVPERMREALMAGEPPWDGVDAVFISHYHDDHFSPRDMLELLRLREGFISTHRNKPWRRCAKSPGPEARSYPAGCTPSPWSTVTTQAESRSQGC